MNSPTKVTVYSLLIFMLILACMPLVAHAESTNPQSYFADSDVSEVVEIWNKFGQVVHTVYYNSKPYEWAVVGTCPYYANSPEHRVYQVHFYPDGSQKVDLDYRDTGVVEADPPDIETYSNTLQEETEKIIESGVDVDNIADTQEIVDNIHQENVAEQTLKNEPKTDTAEEIEPTSQPTEKIEEPQKQEEMIQDEPTLYELFVNYDEAKGSIEGAGIYEANTRIDLIVHPNEGYDVDYWNGIDGDLFVVLDSDRTVEVYFKAITNDDAEPTEEDIEPETATNVDQVEEQLEKDDELIEEAIQNKTESNQRSTVLLIGGGLIILLGIIVVTIRIKKSK